MATKQFKDYTAKTTPIDTDISLIQEVGLLVKKVTWANTKSTLKTYFDTLYQSILTVASNITVATIELGHASDTTISRSSAGKIAVEGVNVVTTSSTDTLTNKTLTTPTISKPVMSATNPTAQTYTPAAAGTATLDLSISNQHDITMPAGNITIAISNDTNNQLFVVTTTQDATGSRTVTWFTTIKWAGGVAPTLTTTASKRDMFGFKRTGSGTYDGFIIAQNI